MKKQWIAAMGIAALIGVIVYACSKEEGNVQIVTTSTSQPTTPTKPATSTPDLQLVSPHGHRVAETIDQLKGELAVFLSEQYGKAIQVGDIEVGKVSYRESELVSIASILVDVEGDEVVVFKIVYVKDGCDVEVDEKGITVQDLKRKSYEDEPIDDDDRFELCIPHKCKYCKVVQDDETGYLMCVGTCFAGGQCVPLF